MDLAVKYKRKIHIDHVNTKEEIGIIKNASSNGLVTCEVTPHHLFLSEDDYMRLGNRLKVNPPLRTSDDVEALWQGIADGTVATIASDHAPHTIEEKERGLIESPAGLPGLDTFLPLMLTAISQRSLSLEKIVEMTSYNPARIFGIQNRGQIEEGFVADFTVVNLSKDMLLTPDRIFSRCRWSPFESMLMKAKPDAVYLNGKLAAVEGRLVSGENKGKELVF
jgi:dihydroorotase